MIIRVRLHWYGACRRSRSNLHCCWFARTCGNRVEVVRSRKHLQAWAILLWNPRSRGRWWPIALWESHGRTVRGKRCGASIELIAVRRAIWHTIWHPICICRRPIGKSSSSSRATASCPELEYVVAIAVSTVRVVLRIWNSPRLSVSLLLASGRFRRRRRPRDRLVGSLLGHCARIDDIDGWAAF